MNKKLKGRIIGFIIMFMVLFLVYDLPIILQYGYKNLSWKGLLISISVSFFLGSLVLGKIYENV